MRIAIYIRVSSDEQVEGWSLDAQRDQCLALTAARHWTVEERHTYTEPGRSAKTDIRPAFQRMMRHAEMHQFDMIVVHKLDRFSRSLADVVRNVALLKQAHVGLVSVSEPWLDTATPQGEFMLHLFALLAQWDNQNRARETAKGKQARALAGFWNGTLNFGYTTLKQLKSGLWALSQQFEQGEIEQALYTAQSEEIENYMERFAHKTEGDAIPHPKNQHGARLAFEAYAHGTMSDYDVGHLLNREGYRTSGQFGEQPFEADTIRPMLQSRFYLGEVAYKGTWHPGRHEALISQRLFDLCQEARARRRSRTVRQKSKERVYPLARLALCARCERPLRGQANEYETRYYREPRKSVSNCPRKLIPADGAERKVLEYLSGIQLPSDWRERVLELSRLNQGDEGNRETRRKRLEGQLERLKTLYRLGDIEESEYVRERADLRGQIEALQPVLQPELEQAAAALNRIGELLQQVTLEEMEKLFHSLLTTVYLDHSVKGYVVGIEPKPFLKELMDISTLPHRIRTTGGNNDPDGDGNRLREIDKQNGEELVAAGGNIDIMRKDAGNEKQVAEARWMPVIPARVYG
ncbi:MAG: recombinase family protein [Chloroflexota bacterium]